MQKKSQPPPPVVSVLPLIKLPKKKKPPPPPPKPIISNPLPPAKRAKKYIPPPSPPQPQQHHYYQSSDEDHDDSDDSDYIDADCISVGGGDDEYEDEDDTPFVLTRRPSPITPITPLTTTTKIPKPERQLRIIELIPLTSERTPAHVFQEEFDCPIRNADELVVEIYQCPPMRRRNVRIGLPTPDPFQDETKTVASLTNDIVYRMEIVQTYDRVIYSSRLDDTYRVFISMFLEYRYSIVTNLPNRTMTQNILWDIVRSCWWYGHTGMATDKKPGQTILYLGYKLQASPDKGKFAVMPGVPPCANNCDVAVPRQGKTNLTAYRKREEHFAMQAANATEYITTPTSPSPSPSKRRPIVSTRKLVENAREQLDNMDPKHHQITDTIVLICQKTKRRTIVISKPTILGGGDDHPPPPPLTLEKDDESSCDRIKSIVGCSRRVVKRREYANVYGGKASALLINTSFQRELMNVFAKGEGGGDGEQQQRQRQQIRQDDNDLRPWDPDDSSSSDDDDGEAPPPPPPPQPQPQPQQFNNGDPALVAFLRQGGFKRAHVTMPRMQRRQMASIANVMLNLYMEIPAQEIYLDCRLLDHCDITDVIECYLPREIQHRQECMRLCDENRRSTTNPAFPLIPIFQEHFPRLFIAYEMNGNIMTDITHVFEYNFDLLGVDYFKRR